MFALRVRSPPTPARPPGLVWDSQGGIFVMLHLFFLFPRPVPRRQSRGHERDSGASHGLCSARKARGRRGLVGSLRVRPAGCRVGPGALVFPGSRGAPRRWRAAADGPGHPIRERAWVSACQLDVCSLSQHANVPSLAHKRCSFWFFVLFVFCPLRSLCLSLQDPRPRGGQDHSAARG